MVRISLAAVLLFFSTPLVRAQPEGPASAPERYVTIPFQGDFEAIFRDRLRLAKDNEPIRKMLDVIRQDPQKFGLDAEALKLFDLDNPFVRSLLNEMLDGHKAGTLDTRDLGKLVKALKTAKKLDVRGKGDNVPAKDQPAKWNPVAPSRGGQANRQMFNTDQWARLVEDWIRNREIADWLRDSPAFQKGLGDLRSLMDFERAGSIWGLDRLPEHLRFAQNIDLKIGDGIAERLRGFSMPRMPSIDLPRFNVGGLGIPAVPLPGFGGIGGDRILEFVVWGLVIVVGVVLGWQILKSLKPPGKRSGPAAHLGPWPVEPAQVSTRSQLVQAFDYLAVLLLGEDIRSWNHRAIAAKLKGATKNAAQVTALADLYELARYTTGEENLSDVEKASARRAFSVLGGVGGP